MPLPLRQSARVVSATPSLKPAFLSFVADIEHSDAQDAEIYALAKSDFHAYVQSLLDEEKGLNLGDGRVPCSHRWIMSDDASIVGVARIRHNVGTPFLAESAGHIGYEVRPSHRGLGYGHVVLSAALAEARRIGLNRVLLFTAANNLASKRVIERQGGVLEATQFSEFWGEQLSRYWIDIIQITPHILEAHPNGDSSV